MKIRALLGALAAPLTALTLAGCGAAVHTEAVATGSGELKVSGPHEHENLQVWLVHGPDQMQSDREVMPLEEALERKLVVVHETGNVNELAIENVGDDIDVFVQSGDIVQGGKQDRTISVDLVLGPKSGKVPLPSFCVEQGRWSPRGAQAAQIAQIIDNAAVGLDNAAPGEAQLDDVTSGLQQLRNHSDVTMLSASLFSISENNVPTNALKKAVLVDNDQSKVWQEVANAQGALAMNASAFGQVVDASSPTSLELTLNTEAVQKARTEYVEALQSVIAGNDDVIGCVVAINGRLDSAEVYGSRALFDKLWPKLLRGVATAAVVEQKEGAEIPAVSMDDVCGFLAEPKDERRAHEVAGVSMAIAENEMNHVVESRAGDELLHRIYLAK